MKWITNTKIHTNDTFSTATDDMNSWNSLQTLLFLKRVPFAYRNALVI